MNTTIPPRLTALRHAMQQHTINACLIPSADPHLSEYMPEHWQARTWFSGFDGSAGTLVVTSDWAGLWTDSRYFEQAEKQLEGTGITLMRQRTANVPEPVDWLIDHLDENETLAVAGDSLSLSLGNRLESLLSLKGACLDTTLDLPGEAWERRPDLPREPVFEHAINYAIVSRQDKLIRVRQAMAEATATHHLVSSLADIAWITNLRGSDVSYNPIFLAHLLITEKHATLFVDRQKLDKKLQQTLADDGIELADYAAIGNALSALPEQTRIMYSPSQIVMAISDAIPDEATRLERPNPSTGMKAVKTEQALQHVREVMRQDGAALVQGFHQIEQALNQGHTVTELDVADILYKTRSARPGFISESFNTIAGYMANGALPHYAATQASHATLKAEGLLLVDSGGQYLGGTTDVTRVWAFGSTTEEQRQDFTLVMKGAINLSHTHFPQGASGPQLDALARAPLWAQGYDFGHGTGHGVGYFLNVHEGPQSIRPPFAKESKIVLQPGMITSIEPGLYKPGRHGIRHENLAVTQLAEKTEFGQFLQFETLTLCPFDTRAIETDLLSKQERQWLNDYHAKVERELAPLLDNNDRQWLAERCKPLA